MSKASSTPARTSSPTDALRALLADDFPAWSDEPRHEALASRLGVAPRAARDLLAAMDVRAVVPLAHLGKLDEAWLFRAPTSGSLLARTDGLAGLFEAVELEGNYAIMRTLAQDAIERERILRALHAAVGERPVVQLHRTPPALARKPSKEDWALVAALVREPDAPVETLAKAARTSPKLAKERLTRLASERVVVLEATPKELELSHVIVRASPSSTAAARRAIETVESVVRAWLPKEGEVSYADALVVGRPSIEAALDVPGVASVELLPVRARRRDESLSARALSGA